MSKTTGALDNQRTNLNILNNKFSLVFHRVRQVAIEALEFETPDVSLPVARQTTPFGIDIPLHGNKLEYSSFSIKFKVDQKASNYLFLLKWMKALGTESSFDQVLEEYFSDKEILRTSGALYSDISVVPLTGKNLPNLNWLYTSAFPTHLSGLSFDNTSNDSKEQIASVRFTFESEIITPIALNPTAPFFDTTHPNL